MLTGKNMRKIYSFLVRLKITPYYRGKAGKYYTMKE